ncbi:MAG: 2-oxoacid:acceptor oxidoreductase family protein [Synergistaceae bacterium]|jgi:2-oxoglutarate ferredoxin oxidoreductase subunit gamma|nr:2-oxoacid:acceptor oxidoreductase family protein [Synergistaceae bacterium]
MKQRWEIIFSGVGGQGLLLSGNLLGAAVSVIEKRQAVMTCTYGTETRGTFTKSDVILSDGYIDFPEVLDADVVVSLAQIAYDRYVDVLKPKTLFLYNSNQVKEAPSPARQVGLPMEEMAAQAGAPAAVNIVALGILTALTKCVQPTSIQEMLTRHFKGRQDVLGANIKAFEAGLEEAGK